jgi:DNA-binding NtrC family response regulator
MKKLLLVDDNRDFLQILSIALEKDFEVYKADGLSQALKVLDTVPINAICSDFYMRDGTGLDLIKEIRCKNITLPFLLMSGSDDTRFIDIARSYDALFCCKTDDLLSKIKAL